jgi:Inner membrane protein YgaP-like, transmembrane domain
MKAFFRFLASPAGRVIRAVAGLVLIVLGLAVVGGVGGWILAIVGLVPLAAGVFDKCVFAPLFALPFNGSRLRKAVEEPKSS